MQLPCTGQYTHSAVAGWLATAATSHRCSHVAGLQLAAWMEALSATNTQQALPPPHEPRHLLPLTPVPPCPLPVLLRVHVMLL